MSNVIKNPLDFEKNLTMQEAHLEELKERLNAGDEDIRKEYAELEKKVTKLRKETYEDLSVYQKVQISRHQNRPLTLDYINLIFTDFVELHGDRCFGDDFAIIGGLAKISGKSVIIVGHQRGKDTQERLKCNFGMAEPEGYRKALRLMKQAEKFNRPIITFIDTPGAYPGIGAEERGQGEAIARNMLEMSNLKVPIICIVIGEGSSGGALAIAVGDRVVMLENAVYSILSPEGFASILYKDASKAKEAAENMKITAEDLKKLKIIDKIIEEPEGGAQNDFLSVSASLKDYLISSIKELKELLKWQLKKVYMKN